MKRIFSVNENYFDVIDTEDKAYFLGLLYADGYVYTATTNNYFEVSLADEQLVRDFKIAIESEHKITPLKKISDKHQQIYRLQINSKKLCNSLTNLGCHQNKSLSLTLPDSSIVPLELLNHFIRGYFDGDGSVWEGKRKVMTTKDKAKKSGYRDRIVHNVKFNITGNHNFIEALQKHLIENIGLNVVKLARYKNRHPNICTMEYSGRSQMRKFYDYIYKDYKYCLLRKKLKFESILNCANTQ